MEDALFLYSNPELSRICEFVILSDQACNFQ